MKKNYRLGYIVKYRNVLYYTAVNKQDIFCILTLEFKKIAVTGDFLNNYEYVKKNTKKTIVQVES